MRRVGRTARAGRKGVVTVLAWGRQVSMEREEDGNPALTGATVVMPLLDVVLRRVLLDTPECNSHGWTCGLWMGALT